MATVFCASFGQNFSFMEEEIKEEIKVEETPVSGLDALRAKMEAIRGEQLDDEALYKAAEEYITKNEAMNEKLSQGLAADPRMAQVFADIAEGKRSSSGAFARYFGKSYLTMEEGTPEYEELMKSDEEFHAELERATKAKQEYDANIETSLPVLAEFCKENGYDEEEFLDKLSEIILPILSGVYTKENLVRLDKALRYDKDVEDAAIAGEVKGRNTNIRDMREDVGDGMAMVQNVAPPVMPKRKKGNALLDMALKA